MSHLHRSGKHSYPPYGLCSHIGSSSWSPGYNEDQIALVILDLSNFMAQAPVILGTPMISHFMNVIRETEIDTLVTPWVNAWVAYLWLFNELQPQWKMIRLLVECYLTDDELVNTKDTKMIDAFLSHIIHARMRTAYTGVRLNVMTQALHDEDGSLPQDLMIQNAYTDMHNGSKNVDVIIRNSMTYPETLRKKVQVARVVVATWVPEPPMQTGVIKALDKAQGHQMPKLTVKQRQEKLFEKLDLSGLESWPLKPVDSAWSLLAEYHDIFSLEPSKLGCTHSTEHVAKVTDDASFKE